MLNAFYFPYSEMSFMHQELHLSFLRAVVTILFKHLPSLQPVIPALFAHNLLSRLFLLFKKISSRYVINKPLL